MHIDLSGLRKCNNDAKRTLYNQLDVRCRLLDLGCGRGGDTAKWRERQFSVVTGIDSNIDAINCAKERTRSSVCIGGPKATLIVGDIFDAEATYAAIGSLTPGMQPEYDAAVSMFVLNHGRTMQHREALSIAARCLRIGGKFIIVFLAKLPLEHELAMNNGHFVRPGIHVKKTKNSDAYTFRLDDLSAGNFYDFQPPHEEYIFDEDEFLREASNANFKLATHVTAISNRGTLKSIVRRELLNACTLHELFILGLYSYLILEKSVKHIIVHPL